MKMLIKKTRGIAGSGTTRREELIQVIQQGSCHRWRRTAEHDMLPGVNEQVCGFSIDCGRVIDELFVLFSDYKHTTANVAFQSFLFFLLLEMDHVSTQAVYIYLSNL